MGAGYFDDGTVDIELGAHVFALPPVRRRNITFQPHDRVAVNLDSGGGEIELDLRAQRLRANLGDAERYIYEKLVALATSDDGSLGYEDNREHQHVYGSAVCTGGRGEVRGHKFADMELDFVCGEKDSEPAFAAVPAAPGTYAGTTDAQSYALAGFGFITLPDGCGMAIEMRRNGGVRSIPRARGARTTPPAGGAVITFTLTVPRLAGAENLSTDLEDLLRSLGPRHLDLVANGNTYSDVVVDRFRPDATDARATIGTLELIHEV